MAEDEGDLAASRVLEESDVPGKREVGLEERMRLGEEQFVSAMVKDLVARRGEEAAQGMERTVEERIAAIPEPWKSRTRRELERLREDLGQLLAEAGKGGSGNASSVEGVAGPEPDSSTESTASDRFSSPRLSP